MAQIRLDAPGQIFRADIGPKNLKLGKTLRIGANVQAEMDAETGDLSAIAVKKRFYDAALVRKFKPLRREQIRKRRLPSEAEEGDVEVRRLLASVTKVTVLLEIQHERMLDSSVCGGDAPAGGNRRWARAVHRMWMRTVVRYEYKLEFEQNIRKNGRWQFHKIVDEGSGTETGEDVGRWSKRVFIKDLEELAPCIDPGQGAKYNRWEPVNNVEFVLREAPRPASSKKKKKKTSKKKTTKKV